MFLLFVEPFLPVILEKQQNRLQTKTAKTEVGVTIGPHDCASFDQTHTQLNSQSLYCTNGWWARGSALSQFAFVPHNLFSWVCPLCSVYAPVCAQATHLPVRVSVWLCVFEALWLWLSPCPCGTSTSVIQWHTVKLLLLDRGSQRH